MIRAATRIVRLAFSRETSSEPVDEVAVPAVPVVGYCADFLFSGSLALEAQRLTDLLNACEEIELVNVVVQWLDDGGLIHRPQVSFQRSELLAVQAGGSPGNPANRRPTRQSPVAGATGPYTFDGYLHTRRGADAALDIGRRDPMIPLTNATIQFALGPDRVVHGAPTLIVNRNAATRLRPAGHGDRIAVA